MYKPVLLAALVACGHKESESDFTETCGGKDMPCPGDADSDTDTDTDSDADGDADTDATGTTATTTTSTTGTTTSGVFTLTTPDMTTTYGSPSYAQCPWYLPVQFSCDGPNPEISWSNVPVGTVSLLLLLQDPDAGNYPHWGVVNIPPTETGLAQAVSGTNVSPHTLPQGDLDGDGVDDGALELKNGSGGIGYYGSCPPSVHEYDWTLWALDTFVTTPFSGSAAQQFSDAAAFANQHSLGMATMCHLYGP